MFAIFDYGLVVIKNGGVILLRKDVGGVGDEKGSFSYIGIT
jgi:hypothetical protein